MQYLCLVYHDEREVEVMSPAECAAAVGEAADYDDELRRGGHFVASDALEFSPTATTIRVRQGRVVVCDGPFAETRERLAGFVLIDARDLNEAIRVAARCPSARLGCVEVRPVKALAIG